MKKKYLFDRIMAFVGLVVFSPVLFVVWILIRIKMPDGPAVFTQKRVGKGGRLFTMYKFRSMTDERDEDGNLLPDDVRLTPFGKRLRESSLDELPELINMFKGDMSVVGPRPQLVRDMVFFSDEEMQRQSVLPGLTGLAQINGRNNISWEDKFKSDLQYIKNISFSLLSNTSNIKS